MTRDLLGTRPGAGQRFKTELNKKKAVKYLLLTKINAENKKKLCVYPYFKLIFRGQTHKKAASKTPQNMTKPVRKSLEFRFF
ncbi:hypothetical protein E5C31_19655 [Providencia rettgeri]|nr:hypothetical protein [Providencia rettgeri]